MRATNAARWTAALVVVLSALCAPALAGQRVALVIGNAAYEAEGVPPLANPGNDARAVGDAFERLGYSVTRAENAGYDALRRALRDFKRAAGASEVAVVFYAGHGIEVDKDNYLVPVDARLAHVDDVKYEAVPLDWAMDAVGGAQRLGVVVLDACRNNPFTESMQRSGTTRSVGRGLARVAPAGATLVAYAAKDGTTADDDAGRGHSPYTEALLAHLETPGLDVGRMFRKVRDAVVAETGGRQEPVRYGSLPGRDIYLASGAPPPPKDAATAGAGGTPRPPPPSGDAARAAYEAAERIGTVAALRLVVTGFPDSIYAKLAQEHIDKQGGSEPLVVAGGDPDDAVPAPTPEAVERGLGLSREERRLVQMGLSAAGHDAGGVDGMFGGRTRRALRGWQESKEVEVTGYLTGEQWEVLLALGREEAERRAREEERQRAEAEERRRAEAERERKAREEAERRRRARLPGTKFRDCPECPELVVVPSGSYMMGSPSSESGRYDNEGPVHRVRIGRPFAVGVYEVTFGEWDACVSGGGCGRYRPSDEGWGRGRRPVINVSWDNAKAYVGWLSRKTGEEYRLLSESEWEYVARAGTRTAYWWGDEIGRNRANCRDCGSRWDGKQTAPVGSFSANGFGLYDVHGNVWEWVEDCWEGDCGRRVLRGGSWLNYPRDLRSAFRIRYTSGDRINLLGFRVARTLTP